MDLDSFLVSLYVRIDDWWQANHSSTLRRPGRRALLSGSEVLTLAILAQWPRWRSERDFWRFADAHLRCYFTTLCSQSQLNRRIRAPEPGLRALQRVFAKELCEPSVIYRVLDTALIPAIVRVRACRKGLFAGQASFCRRASKTEWAYGFKVALVVDPEGVITTFGPGPGGFGRETHRGGPHNPRPPRSLPGGQKASWEPSGSGAGWRPTGRLLRLLQRTTPPGVVEGGSPLGGRQAPDYRRGDRPAQGLLRPGASPREDPERSAESSSHQGHSRTLVVNGSTALSADRCATWRTCWSSSLHISRLKGK